MEVLRVEHIKKYFVKKGLFGSGPAVRAADDVSFSLDKGQVLVLAGESGSGKSTIARIILQSINADSGSIFFEGQDVSRNPGLIRANCQMVHQDPYDSINPRMKVQDIIAEPLEILNIGTKKDRRDRVIQVLREVKMEPAGQMMEKHPHMLSGGQRQRVVLARALAPRPKVIVADEPVSMLDVSTRAEMLELMSELKARHEISFIYITHDLATARSFGQRIAILYLGRIIEAGDIDDVLLNPRHPYTRALIDAVSEPDPENLHKYKEINIIESRQAGTTGCRFKPRCPYAIEKCNTEPKLEGDDGHHVACFVEMD